MSGTALALRVLNVLNLLAGAGFAIALAASWPGAGMLAARLALKYGPAFHSVPAIAGIRILLALGLVAVLPTYRLLTALSGIITTLRDGDPFLPGNAARVRTIAWSLLAIQVLDLALGGVYVWLSGLHVEVATWTPSIGGWLAVLVAFVLARVFAIGAAMRDDLAGTV